MYIWIYIYIYNCIHILQEEQSLCFLKAFQNIHLGPLRITFSSPFCVAGVGRSIITLFEINHKILELLEGGNARGVRQSSMLGFYGEGCAKETKHVHCRKLNIYPLHYIISNRPYPVAYGRFNPQFCWSPMVPCPTCMAVAQHQREQLCTRRAQHRGGELRVRNASQGQGRTWSPWNPQESDLGGC